MKGSAKGIRQTDTQDRFGRYYTPEPLARAIVEGVDLPISRMLPAVTWDPSAGSGVLLNAVHAADPGSSLYGIDLDPSAPVHRSGRLITTAMGDFLTGVSVNWPRPDLVIMNPPYSVKVERLDAKGAPIPDPNRLDQFGRPLPKMKSIEVATDHVVRALQVSNRWVIALTRADFASGKSRQRRLFQRYPLREKLQVVGRPSFTGGGTSSSEYAVFFFDKLWTRRPMFGWLEW